MANIPIEKKSSMAWLWWLLLALGIAALLWFLIAGADDEDVVLDDNQATVTQPINDTAAISAYSVGDTVNLDGIPVTEVTGDMAFMVDTNGESMLVLFDEVKTPNDVIEGQYDINVGSMVNLDGMVRSASDPLPEGVNASIPAGTAQYIYATSVEMVS